VNCGEALHALALGNAAPCPDNNCGAHWNGHAYEFPHFTSDGLFYGGVNPYGSNGNRPTLKTATPEEKQRNHQIRTRFGHNPFGELSAEEIVFDFIGFNLGIAPQNGGHLKAPGTDFVKPDDVVRCAEIYCPRRASAKLCTFGVRLPVATHSRAW
jgi:hypothetical protein